MTTTLTAHGPYGRHCDLVLKTRSTRNSSQNNSSVRSGINTKFWGTRNGYILERTNLEFCIRVQNTPVVLPLEWNEFQHIYNIFTISDQKLIWCCLQDLNIYQQDIPLLFSEKSYIYTSCKDIEPFLNLFSHNDFCKYHSSWMNNPQVTDCK